MDLLFTDLTPWHWLILGILLCAVELFAPTTVLLWAGIAALATGVLTFLVPILNWQLQIALFAVLAVATTLAGRMFYRLDRETLDAPVLNRRGDTLLGRDFILTQIDAAVWRAAQTRPQSSDPETDRPPAWRKYHVLP